MTVLQPGHDSRVPWPSTALPGQFAPKLPSREAPVGPRRSILCSFSGVAVVGKFRSRIRILQFSTRKITPHGNVYISSAIRPIVYFFCVVSLAAEPIWGSPSLCATSLAHPCSGDPPSGPRLKGLLLPALVVPWLCAARTPKPPKAW